MVEKKLQNYINIVNQNVIISSTNIQGSNMKTSNYENIKLEVWTNGRKLELLFENKKDAKEYLEKLEKKYKDTYLLTIKKYK